MLLLVGDDWAEDHHDIEVQDETGRRLGKARLPEGMAGIARLHAMLGEHIGEEEDERVEVVVGIETERGPWVAGFARGRLPGVRDQSVTGGPVSGTAPGVWG